MSRYLSDFFQLRQPIACVECKTIFLQILEESFDEAPVHCRECGAFICDWASVKTQALPQYGTYGSADAHAAIAKTRASPWIRF